MAGLIVLKPGVDWAATGGLFDWTLEFLIRRLSDKEAVERLREMVANNVGSMWLEDFSPQVQEEIVTRIRCEFVDAGTQDLPESEHKAEAIRRLQDLVDLTSRLEVALTEDESRQRDLSLGQ